MTGTGTQADPYIVMNYDDLCHMTGGKSIYYKLGADIDFAQTDRKPDAGAINICMAGLDGDGHTVSNFFGRADNSTARNTFFRNDISNTIVIKNINFKGFYLSGGVVFFAATNGRYLFSDCRFSVKINDTASSSSNMLSFFPSSDLNDCEILLEGTSDLIKPIAWGSVKGCLIKLNLAFYNHQSMALFDGDISFSGITGNIVSRSTDEANYILNNGNILNSYFALNFDKISSFSTGNNFSGVNFYDKEVMANLVDKMPSANNFYALTTEQCKSAEYLQSIGFPCTSG